MSEGRLLQPVKILNNELAVMRILKHLVKYRCIVV